MLKKHARGDAQKMANNKQADIVTTRPNRRSEPIR